MPVRGVVLDSESHTYLSIVRGANGFLGSDVVAPAAAVWLSDQAEHVSLTRSEVARFAVCHGYVSHLEQEGDASAGPSRRREALARSSIGGTSISAGRSRRRDDGGVVAPEEEGNNALHG